MRESAPQFISHFCFLHVLRLFWGGMGPSLLLLLSLFFSESGSSLPLSFQPISSNLHHYPFVAVITFHDARDEMGERDKRKRRKREEQEVWKERDIWSRAGSQDCRGNRHIKIRGKSAKSCIFRHMKKRKAERKFKIRLHCM